MEKDRKKETAELSADEYTEPVLDFARRRLIRTLACVKSRFAAGMNSDAVFHDGDETHIKEETGSHGPNRKEKIGKLQIALAVIGSFFIAVTVAFAVTLGLYLTRNSRAEAAFVKKNSYTAECFYVSDSGELISFKDVFVVTRSRPEHPYRTGHRFDGWFTSSDFCESSRFDPFIVPAKKRIVLYGKWVARYTVSFDSNGGQPLSSVTLDEGTAITVMPVPENAAPFGFDGWYDSAALESKAEFPFVPRGSVVLYAKWRQKQMEQTIRRGMRTLSLDEEGVLWEQYIDGEPEKKLTDIRAFSVGEAHVLAIDKNGRLWVWGEGYYGQLGDGTRKNRASPIRLLAGRKIVSAAAGFTHSLAVDSAGGLWAWGNNGHGQLGDGTFDESLTPKRIKPEVFFVSVTAENHSTAAVDKDGTVWSWGS